MCYTERYDHERRRALAGVSAHLREPVLCRPAPWRRGPADLRPAGVPGSARGKGPSAPVRCAGPSGLRYRRGRHGDALPLPARGRQKPVRAAVRLQPLRRRDLRGLLQRLRSRPGAAVRRAGAAVAGRSRAHRLSRHRQHPGRVEGGLQPGLHGGDSLPGHGLPSGGGGGLRRPRAGAVRALQGGGTWRCTPPSTAAMRFAPACAALSASMGRGCPGGWPNLPPGRSCRGACGC